MKTSTETQALPAATLLALAEAAILGLEDSLWLAGVEPSKFAATAVANHRAARSASPVTLEEALMARYGAVLCRYAQTKLGWGDIESLRSAEGELQEHARRLAGEGGGQ